MRDEAALLDAAHDIEGLSLRQVAKKLNWVLPMLPASRKGWVGLAMESLLGAEASTRPAPDFISLGIELKTLPINHLGKPSESTFVTSISLLHAHEETWASSTCRAKLNRVLWVPVEAHRAIPFPERRVGRAILWSPSEAQEKTLERDWQELMALIVMGRLHEVNAQLGEVLQVRPKAASGRSLRYAYDENGQKHLTLPRGFYLRARFTEKIFEEGLSCISSKIC